MTMPATTKNGFASGLLDHQEGLPYYDGGALQTVEFQSAHQEAWNWWGKHGDER